MQEILCIFNTLNNIGSCIFHFLLWDYLLESLRMRTSPGKKTLSVVLGTDIKCQWIHLRLLEHAQVITGWGFYIRKNKQIQIKYLPEPPDLLYQIHSCMVPDEEVEILVFLLIFLFQKMWKTEDCSLSEDTGQEGGESRRITYQWNVDSFLFFANCCQNDRQWFLWNI